MFEPHKRPTASACLGHPFIAPMSRSLSSPIGKPLTCTNEHFAFDKGKPTIDELRIEVLKECKLRLPYIFL